MAAVGTSEVETSQFLPEQLVDLARLHCKLVVTALTDVPIHQSTVLAEDVVAVSTLHRHDDQVLTLGAREVLLDLKTLRVLGG